MASRIAALAGLALALVAGAATAQTGPALTAPIVPQPLSVTRDTAGAGFRVADGTALVAPARDGGATAAARYLSELSRQTRGLDLPVRADGAGVRFERRGGFAPEAYDLTVDASGVRIVASDDAGLFYGAVSLWQLMTAQPGKGAADLDAVTIHDAPRFRWRGLMVDSARHFQSAEEIERILDAMAAHKLNVLHWHLTDDQGWRLQIAKYPRLTEIGAWRTPAPGSPDGAAPYGGFYTQAQVRRVVAHAAARHITVVPEIEMPGHAVSALLAYPQFGAGAAPDPASQAMWGGFPNVYATDDKTFGFMTDVLTEVMALFPGPFIHVGGDEVFKERWNGGGSPDPAAQQQAFTHRIAGFLEAHHRRLVGWDEILQGGDMPADAVVTSWHGIDGGIAAANTGHDAVLAPAPIMYFDNRQGLGADEPPGRGWLVRLQDAYSFEPLPPTLPPAAQAHILGLQANVWTEHIRTEAQFEAMAFPRIVAVAETAWSAPARKDWPGFARRVPAELARLDALGIRADRASVKVLATPTPAGEVALSAQLPGEIRYTTDGAEPTAASPLYGQPIAPGRLRAALFLDGARVGPILDRLPESFTVRSSQELRLCDEKLTLNLEGPAGPNRSTYFVNPVNACWIWAGADLGANRKVTVSFARLAFNFGLDPAHNTAMVHPPRGPSGEIEIRPDTCLADPLAIAPIPPGRAGDRGEVTLTLPPRTGRHDLCVTYTSRGFDPFIALDEVRLAP